MRYYSQVSKEKKTFLYKMGFGLGHLSYPSTCSFPKPFCVHGGRSGPLGSSTFLWPRETPHSLFHYSSSKVSREQVVLWESSKNMDPWNLFLGLSLPPPANGKRKLHLTPAGVLSSQTCSWIRSTFASGLQWTAPNGMLNGFLKIIWRISCRPETFQAEVSEGDLTGPTGSWKEEGGHHHPRRCAGRTGRTAHLPWPQARAYQEGLTEVAPWKLRRVSKEEQKCEGARGNKEHLSGNTELSRQRCEKWASFGGPGSLDTFGAWQIGHVAAIGMSLPWFSNLATEPRTLTVPLGSGAPGLLHKRMCFHLTHLPTFVSTLS